MEKEQTKIIIIDSEMGSGKTCAAINYINNSPADERFLIITPYNSEVERYKTECRSKNFVEPYRKDGRKLNSIKEYIRQGRNIVSTHALFQRFDQEVVELCSILNYTLIMDEVAEVVNDANFSKSDIANLLNVYCDYDPDTGLLSWREEYSDYSGKFNDAKNMCELGGLALARDTMLMWIFPVEIFKAFQKTFILTYMFNAQLQKYYYDYYNLKYEFMSVEHDESGYHFAERGAYFSRRELIHIFEDDKMNKIGERKFSLTVSWYERNRNSEVMKRLKDNIYNYFNNKIKSKTGANMWTTFQEFKGQLKGHGYTKGFLRVNARAINEYRGRYVLAYPVNIYLNPVIKGFFHDHGITVDEDGYALSEMLQWIWRSAIRDGEEIWIYVPSLRMRLLLRQWILDIKGT